VGGRILLLTPPAEPTLPLGLQYSAYAAIASGAMLGLFMVAVGLSALRMSDRPRSTPESA